MKADVQKLVSSSQVCHQAKPDHSKYPRLLEPLPVPFSAWQIISLDFVEGPPSSHRKNCILVVVDKFIKYSHFIPLSYPFTLVGVAKVFFNCYKKKKVFFNQIYKLHSMTSSIVSNWDKVFSATFSPRCG